MILFAGREIVARQERPLAGIWSYGLGTGCMLISATLVTVFALATQVSLLEEYVRNVPRIDGVSEITLPGDPERRTLADRQANGIPIDDGNWQALQDLAQNLGIADN